MRLAANAQMMAETPPQTTNARLSAASIPPENVASIQSALEEPTSAWIVSSNGAPSRSQPTRDAVGHQGADERGGERARRSLGRRGVPKRVDEAGRRGRPDPDDIGCDQPDCVARHGGDQAQQRQRIGVGRGLQDDSERNKQRPADRRAEHGEQQHEANHRQEELAGGDCGAHCASSRKPALMSVAVCASRPSSAELLATAAAACGRA